MLNDTQLASVDPARVERGRKRASAGSSGIWRCPKSRFRPYIKDYKVGGLLGLYCCAPYLWNLPYTKPVTELMSHELGPSEQ